MSRYSATPTEALALWYICNRCGADPHHWCHSRTGRPANYLHAPRHHAAQADQTDPPEPDPPRRVSYMRQLAERTWQQPCPKCAAPAGHPCHTPTGRTVPPADTHAARFTPGCHDWMADQ